MTYKTVIAIDPGMGSSGIAIHANGKFSDLKSGNLWELFEYIYWVGINSNNDTTLFLIENSNLDKANWHGSSARGNVGKNKAISKEIVDHCKRCGVNYKELKPAGYSKVYAGAKRKYFESDTGWKGKSNKHNRAAAAMIMRYLR